ncbi:pleckstrin homology domain-containing family G member 5-like [Belonocnema kinseyi]|uniref:pleckstrin homology domain-containing family G member 5-like n=1 Tax=Belonocnema kinseyi TaxID=2817044 RepID=UPI00143D6829|nr:pleckstrin homology domain-containing family G member 5-like [Belonocnema kinseyi]
MEQQARNGLGHLRASARNLSVLRLGFSSSKQRVSQSVSLYKNVRSRSLTQLDALGTSMLDAGEHHLGGSPQQQPLHPHPHQPQHHSQNLVESSPRFLVPNAPSTESAHPNRTRHKLSRSQVSSSEYFSVSFEIGEDAGALDREEFLPAAKGSYLAEVLSSACERRGVDLSRVDVFLESFSTPLPILTTETSCLGGKHLRLSAKDDKLNARLTSQRNSQNVSLRKASGSYRGRSGRFFSVSTEDSSVDSEVGTAATITSGKSSTGAAALKASKQRWSGFFTNTKGTKMESLVEQLNSYTKHGVPRLSDIQLPYDLTVNEEDTTFTDSVFLVVRLRMAELSAPTAWCETQKDCNRLRLLDILVKPMQRLTKYSLLLKAVYKNTENEDQRAELTIMIKSVDNFVASVNAALKRSEETARLASAASRLESYDVVESRDEELEKLIRMHSSLDITTAPMPGCPKDALRTLLREGDLKLRDAASSKVEVHIFLLTDMLLICKPSTKKASSSSNTGISGGVLKIIRQPYVVDRIRVHELKEPSSLGLVYLNEYGAASAALVLSAGEPKLAKSWMESIRKAQQQFVLMKLPPLGSTFGQVSRQASTFLGDGDFEMEEGEGIPRTPRGSSRASRISSLAHSHSGSMEMEGASPSSSSFLPSYNPSRNVSVETTEPPRASSVSSEEGGEIGSGHSTRAIQISRRSLLSKSPTPNTLSVQVPAYSGLGQSLPNLTLATSPQTSTVSATPPNSLLIVPQITKSKDTLLSPGHRGISYPPPSPPRGALRRAFAIPQSRNPPLLKTRHINASVTQTLQAAVSLDTEAIEERRRRLEPSQIMPSTSSIAEEKK